MPEAKHSSGISHHGRGFFLQFDRKQLPFNRANHFLNSLFKFFSRQLNYRNSFPVRIQSVPFSLMLYYYNRKKEDVVYIINKSMIDNLTGYLKN